MANRRIDSERQYEVKSIWERQHRMIRLMFLGWSNVRIGAFLGVTPQNVSDVRNSRIVKEQMSTLQAVANVKTADLRLAITEDAGKSLSLLQEIRDGEHDGATLSLRARVAQDLLDRTSATNKKVESTFEKIVSEEMLRRINERAAEAKRLASESGKMIVEEAEYVEAV